MKKTSLPVTAYFFSVAFFMLLIMGLIYVKKMALSPVNVPSQQENLTANWQLYRNEKYGFEFHYPGAGYAVTEQESIKPLLHVNVANTELKKTVFEALILPTDKTEFSKNVENSSNCVKTIFAGKTAYRCTSTTRLAGVTYIFVQMGNVTFDMSPYSSATEITPMPALSKTSYAILSSFKFIEPTPDASTLQTYHDATYGFAFKYPPDFDLYIDKTKITSSSYIPACDPETSIACLVYDKQKYYPNTNFDSAGFSVNRISTAKDATACASLTDRGYTDQAMTKQTINGTAFDTATVSDAATGHYLTEKLYRVFKNNTCFEVSLRVAQSNFQNYDPSLGVKEFTKADETVVWQKFENILSTFTFATDETGLNTVCASDNDCWCRNFTGAEFVPGKIAGTCDLTTHRCHSCVYD